MRKPSYTCLLARTHAHLLSCHSSAPADGYLGARARGLGVEAKERPCWPWRISRSSASEPCMRAGDGEPAVRHGGPRALVSTVIHLQEVSLAKVTGNHLKVCGGKLSKCSVNRVALLCQRNGRSAQTPTSLSHLLCLYLFLLDKMDARQLIGHTF